ncbi:hypothetical protein [Hymenobacter metallilatus]|uniref:Uncharacterized protein n=1 Tax=Hymenobacter metallilatus TaxID=2493666 RepID=A0A428JPK4_9BACT|nr:hypothetical protein [Hymenobacter metallilatus]RSK35230.1 hypothetical protein EI290_05895 [Hymenobacter metallilatus]
MLRHCLTLLLLLPYLLGLSAGLVGRPEPVGPTAAHPYVHSAECQRQNYLRLDCFDTCNGDQYAVQAQCKTNTAAQLLASFQSIDLHCLPELPGVQPMRVQWLLARYQPLPPRQPLAGLAAAIYQPPRQA